MTHKEAEVQAWAAEMTEQRLSEAIWHAIREGWSVEKFMKEAAAEWDACLYDKRKEDAKSWRKLLERKSCPLGR